ncbi:ninein-like protein isoform X3 [Lampris incognitus]|uniref:ninein-like protein isoform X3 n=1 Tax=Lampris incognitus TaxID=2546036 RepID=UPI0024B51A63|nr:ninein-like protein isoform X3 [Lampris incognitus]
MEEAEQNRYVAQLKVEFDSCDTTATGYLDQDELTTLCHKLHLDAHLPLLLDTLLGEQRNARVNFEEFKEGFVSVLSRSLDISTSEEDSSYMEPVVPEEVKPKFVKGTKRYGRRSRPDSQPELQLSSASDEPPFRTNQDSPLPGVRRAKLRRSTSLESVESLKSDEETGSQKGNILSDLDVRGQQVCWKEEISDPPEKVIAGQMKEMWDELGGGGGGGGGGIRKGGEVSLVCEHLGLQHLDSQELEALLRKSDADWDGRVGLRKILCGAEPVGPSPISSSTPVRPSVTQRGAQKVEEGRLVRSTSPSLLSATVGQRLLSQLDDGTGSTSPEQVITLWSEEGIHNSRNVLQTLDFSLEEKLSLVDLTLALDNELLVSGNGIHQAALISYKNEIQYLQLQAEQASRERDKVKTDLDRADRRNLQLVREVDDHHTTMETLNQTKIRELEQEFRDRLTALRSESELESEVLLQQAERDRVKLQEEVKLLRLQEVSLQGELCCSKQEKRCLEEEVTQVKMKLCEAETCVSRLQRELDQLLQDKYGSLDPASAGLKQEEHFSKVIREYEHQCRELQDKNDELSSELLKSLAGSRKSRRSSALDWSSCRSLTIESDSDDTDLKRGSSPLSSRKPPLSHDQNNLGSLESLGGPAISIETELAMEQLRQKHSQEIQDLKIQLETKVNFYERSLELMKQNMEIERKDICQSFKLEISELEEQRTQAEETLRELEEKLQKEIQKKNVDQEWRVQREQVEMEQNFALEISHLVQRLTSEKDQLEAELKLKMDQEVMSVRTQLEEAQAEKGVLKEKLAVLQQEIQRLEEDLAKKKKNLDEMERQHEKSREEEERLYKENSKYRNEVLDLSNRNLQLSNENSELSAHLHGDQEAVLMLRERLETVSREQEEQDAKVRQLQELLAKQERENLHLQKERELMEREMNVCKEKLESKLSAVALKQQRTEEENSRLVLQTKKRDQQVEKLEGSLCSMDSEVEQLRTQLHAVIQEKDHHAQEVASQQRNLQEAQEKVEELEANMRRLNREKEAQSSAALQEDRHNLHLQSHELLQKMSEMENLNQQMENLTTKQYQMETDRNRLEEQAQKAESALKLVQARHSRVLEEVREQAVVGSREQREVLLARLEEEQKRSRQLEENLQLQTQTAGTQLSLQQEQYEKVLVSLQHRVEEVETKLQAVRLVLQEKIQQLKEQLSKNTKSNMLVKELYMENSQLVKALQVTEQRQKTAEKKNLQLEEKIMALNKLLREIVPTSLVT